VVFVGSVSLGCVGCASSARKLRFRAGPRSSVLDWCECHKTQQSGGRGVKVRNAALELNTEPEGMLVAAKLRKGPGTSGKAICLLLDEFAA
jgi:hypothetical protein